MSGGPAFTLMAKKRTNTEVADYPRIEDHLPGKLAGGNRRTGRKSITLWIREEIILKAGPHPGTALREFIEENFPL